MNTFREMGVEVLKTVDRLDPNEQGVKDTEIGAALPWSFSMTLDLIHELVESGDLYPVDKNTYKNISPWGRLQ